MYALLLLKKHQLHQYSLSEHAGSKGIGKQHLHVLYICITANTNNIITHYLRLTPNWWGHHAILPTSIYRTKNPETEYTMSMRGQNWAKTSCTSKHGKASRNYSAYNTYSVAHVTQFPNTNNIINLQQRRIK